MHRFVGTATAFALVFVIGVSLADEKPAHKEPANDKEFVLKAIAADLAEVHMGKRATTLASSAKVKSFAKKMINAHTKHRKELMSLAKSLKWNVTVGMLPEHKAELEKLNKLSGKEFDTEYMKIMVMGHEKVLTMYEKWEKQAENDKVREMAKKTTPVVREHLEMARKLNES